MSTHPHLCARGTVRFAPAADPGIHALVYAPEHLEWIERELADTPTVTQVARSVRDAVAALIDDPPPRPQYLIIDLSKLSAGELFHLHTIREQGWFGTIIAIGRVLLPLRNSLGVDHAIAPGASLRAVTTFAPQHTMQTRRIPRITG